MTTSVVGLPTMEDRVDGIIREWRAGQPDLDLAGPAVILRVLRAAHHIEGRLNTQVAIEGLRSKGDLDTLTALLRAGPPYQLSPSRLAEALLMTSGGMTSRLDHLAAAGLIERHPDPADRRGVLVQLTETGVAVADRAFAGNLEAQRAMIQGLDPSEQAALGGLLRRLLVGLGDV